jgi:transposase/5S rRNA maturation endonuclease (ribonuclease M5)
MNVLKPALQSTVKTLLNNEISQREINRKTKVDRKTIRRYARSYEQAAAHGNEFSKSPTPEGVATGSTGPPDQNPPPRPPAREVKIPKIALSACEPHRVWIESQVRLGRNAMSIYQDLVELLSFSHRYNSVKRFVRHLKKQDPEQYDRLEFPMGEEAQVDYGQGALTLHPSGKYRRPRLFVMTLKYSGRAFRKVVWKSSKETWCRLHEDAFRYFAGCTQYVTLDNLKEGVIKPDIYDPELNPLYAAMLAQYDVVATPARVCDSNRKGTVENAIKYTQDTALKGRKFSTIEAQNDWLLHWEDCWASRRIHGRAKRQVEEMFQEEKPYLKPLPLVPFRYFEQGTRTVYDDGTIQVGDSYYAASPAPLGSLVTVRIYEDQVEILNTSCMEVIRRHSRSKRPGSLIMKPEDRIFNPSRETDRLLAQAERIGPHTFELCETWFNEEGRTGQRRMYGLVNQVRHYAACHVEKAAEIALRNGLRSSKALRRIIDSMEAEAEERKPEESEGITQQHALIRPGEDYAAFWNQHAAQAEPPAEPAPQTPIVCQSSAIDHQQLRNIWQQASWLRVIEMFQLSVDPLRCRRDDEIWIQSPFTQEQQASLHVSLSANVYKDFSSGKGGGIIQFCREMLRLRNREMGMFQVAAWMVETGISTPIPKAPSASALEPQSGLDQRPAGSNPANRAIEVDLRRYLRSDHPELKRRGISSATCRYLGCGFLPPRANGKPGSPLQSRLVFQIRGVRENGHGLEPIILSHSGRALAPEQQDKDGKYWSYPFRKGQEIYNQDHLLMDEEAGRQVRAYGLVLVEGFFDAAKLVEAGCRNVGALMGAHISAEQIERLAWIQSRIRFPRIVLFLDRDNAGRNGALQALERLQQHNLEVSVFDWDGNTPASVHGAEPIPDSIKDPADMPVERLQRLRGQGLI